MLSMLKVIHERACEMISLSFSNACVVDDNRTFVLKRNRYHLRLCHFMINACAYSSIIFGSAIEQMNYAKKLNSSK